MRKRLEIEQYRDNKKTFLKCVKKQKKGTVSINNKYLLKR